MMNDLGHIFPWSYLQMPNPGMNIRPELKIKIGYWVAVHVKCICGKSEVLVGFKW